MVAFRASGIAASPPRVVWRAGSFSALRNADRLRSLVELVHGRRRVAGERLVEQRGVPRGRRHRARVHALVDYRPHQRHRLYQALWELGQRMDHGATVGWVQAAPPTYPPPVGTVFEAAPLPAVTVFLPRMKATTAVSSLLAPP